ncbi:uncharacterized protein TrAFT101_001586 [Trichoderma asperellum]|uniref:uncharacterized protein n=1 Tax=Trichoderma asperellum TaxID=101201 RepID=UPI003331B9ED|nr:hypothetical protein TrAFT101_001586 [Trichoderma asperellum]
MPLPEQKQLRKSVGAAVAIPSTVHRISALAQCTNKLASAENDSSFGDILPQQKRCFPSIPMPMAGMSKNVDEVTLSGSLR